MSGDGATTGDGLAAETLAAMRPVCSCCGDAATCFGESEGDPPVYACDNCCGHGGEDGHCSPVAPGRVTVEETEHLRASITARMCERLSRREPDWNDLCSYLGAADLFVASPRLLATVIGQRAEIARLTAALDGVRREERERCIAWLRAHDATTTAREAAVELQQCAWGVELLTEPVEGDDATSEESAFTLTINGKSVAMTVGEVTRTTEGRREVFWSTRVATKAAGLRTYDHHHSGSSRMEAVGWTLQVLAGEGMEPTAMTWAGAPATGSAT